MVRMIDPPYTLQECGYVCEECPFPDCMWDFGKSAKAKEKIRNSLRKRLSKAIGANKNTPNKQ